MEVVDARRAPQRSRQEDEEVAEIRWAAGNPMGGVRAAWRRERRHADGLPISHPDEHHEVRASRHAAFCPRRRVLSTNRFRPRQPCTRNADGDQHGLSDRRRPSGCWGTRFPVKATVPREGTGCQASSTEQRATILAGEPRPPVPASRHETQDRGPFPTPVRRAQKNFEVDQRFRLLDTTCVTPREPRLRTDEALPTLEKSL